MTLRKLAEQDHDRIQAYDEAQREASARRYRADLVEALVSLGIPYALVVSGEFVRQDYRSWNSALSTEALTVEGFTFALAPYGKEGPQLTVWDFDPDEWHYHWRELNTLAGLLAVTKKENHAKEEESA